LSSAAPDTGGLTPDQSAAVERCAAAGQETPFRFWEQLDAAGRARLAGQLATIDFRGLGRLVDELVIGGPKPVEVDPAEVRPAPVARLPRTGAERAEAQHLSRIGEEALRAGRVAVLTVAGGQGTRLGFDGPKGCYVMGPITGRTLFRHHAEKVLALSRRYRAAIPWLVMTNPANFAAIADYLSGEDYFGLPADGAHVFRQGMMPAVDPQGRLILSAPDTLAMSPNGHGGTVAALRDSGLLEELGSRGVDALFYFQVDNPLVDVADPVFVGRHLEAGSEMSLKVVAKRDAAEKVGVVVERSGRLEVIEYSDLPAEVAGLTDERGELLHWAGSIAIHVFSVDFLRRVAREGGGLPYHRADKKVPYAGEDGATVQPEESNGVKFESFIFDALPMAERSLVVECAREREFAPVKNATGVDSAESCRRMLVGEWARWIELAGGHVPRRADGGVDGRVEISPLHALDAAELAGKLPPDFAMKPGGDVVLE
jgi:UDP-N-acetylglucosamine/UDP-N-acetylgalactosamine diphosphorylase